MLGRLMGARFWGRVRQAGPVQQADPRGEGRRGGTPALAYPYTIYLTPPPNPGRGVKKAGLVLGAGSGRGVLRVLSWSCVCPCDLVRCVNFLACQRGGGARAKRDAMLILV